MWRQQDWTTVMLCLLRDILLGHSKALYKRILLRVHWWAQLHANHTWGCWIKHKLGLFLTLSEICIVGWTTDLLTTVSQTRTIAVSHFASFIYTIKLTLLCSMQRVKTSPLSSRWSCLIRHICQEWKTNLRWMSWKSLCMKEFWCCVAMLHELEPFTAYRLLIHMQWLGVKKIQ